MKTIEIEPVPLKRSRQKAEPMGRMDIRLPYKLYEEILKETEKNNWEYKDMIAAMWKAYKNK